MLFSTRAVRCKAVPVNLYDLPQEVDVVQRRVPVKCTVSVALPSVALVLNRSLA